MWARPTWCNAHPTSGKTFAHPKNKSLFFFFHSLASSLRYISHNFLLLPIFFSSLLLVLIHAILQNCTVLSLTHWDLSSFLHQMTEWPFLLFLHLFLLFFIPLFTSSLLMGNLLQQVQFALALGNFSTSSFNTKCGLDPRGAMHTQEVEDISHLHTYLSRF